MKNAQDIVRTTELGRQVSFVLGLSRVDYTQVRSIGSLASDFTRQNGHFLIKVPVDIKLLDGLGKIMVWSDCPDCWGKGYRPLRLLPFLFRRCKACAGKRGDWYESE